MSPLPNFPSVYYPSMLVNFRLRFDEALDAFQVPVARSSSDLLGNKSPSTQQGKPTPRPDIVSGSTGDGLSFIVGRIPKSATVELTGYRQAWKFSMEFEYQDLPIDPRLLRSCGVEIYADAVQATNFGAGMVETLPTGTFVRRGRRKSVLEPKEDNLLLIGIVDGWTVEVNESSSTVHMEGRDLRGVLLNSFVDVRKIRNIDLKKPIHMVVRQILDGHPYGGKMTVEALVDDWEGKTIPSPAEKSGVTRVRRGAAGEDAHSEPPGDENLNYWDLIVHYCYLVGAVPYFAGRFGRGAEGAGAVLRIRPARNLFDDVKRSGNDLSFRSPFEHGLPRTDPNIPAWGIRKMVYGKDIKSLKFERKYNGFKPMIVECICLDTSSNSRGKQKLLTARWPATQGNIKQKQVDQADVTGVAPSGSHADSNVLRIPLHGITSKKRLLAIAQDIHQEISRGEMGGAIETKNLASFGGDNQDPDLVRLRPGDTVEIVPDAKLLTAPHTRNVFGTFGDDVESLSFSKAVQDITEKIGDEKLARAIVATANAYNLQRFFRVANVRMNWSDTDGLALAFDYQNYVEARNVQPTSTGPVKKKPTQVTAKVSQPRKGVTEITFEEGSKVVL